jgi:cell shape-determining protein MreD
VSDLPAKNALNNVCSIQTVNAIGSESSSLSLENFKVLGIVELVTIIETYFKICQEVFVFFKGLLHNSHKFRQVFPLHFLAFSVEVKPNVLDVWVFQLVDHSSHFCANLILPTLLVNQIHAILRPYELFGLSEVHFSG